MSFCGRVNTQGQTRREALLRGLGGLGGIALTSLLAEDRLGAATVTSVPRPTHFAPKAKNVIFILMAGGPSHLDLFDPKPMLSKYDGQNAPFSVVQRANQGSTKLFGSPFRFKPHGQSGIEVSELLPYTAQVVDEIALIRSGVTERIDHDTAQLSYQSGRNTSGFPSVGSWVSYALGTENRNLPAYVTLVDANPTIGPRAWSSGWLPPLHQGSVMTPLGTPMHDLDRPKSMSVSDEGDLLKSVNALNSMHRERLPGRLELDARIANYELAARMQLEAMRSVDFATESDATRELYGLNHPETGEYGMRCLLARRLVESGVRFVHLINGGWDHHSGLAAGIRRLCARTDRGVGALIQDLKQRGLLDSTLVVWGGEFGRLPTVERADGRDHNPHGFSLWMAGGGVKSGVVYGATDDFGYAAVENKVTHSDLHATLLHLLGLEASRVVYEYEGRQETLVGVNPNRVIREILA
jgi:hypothetical protein